MPVTPGATGASFDVLLAFSLDPEANKRVQSGVSTLEAELKRLQEEAEKVGDEYKKSSEEVKKSSKDASKQLIQEARIMKREAAAITDDLKAAQISALKNISSFIGGISQSALIAGTAITGGIFAEVAHYVGSAKEATAVTQAWKRETDSLSRSRTRVDEVLAREALPLLQQAAKVANQAAGFIEKHPEIVSAALKTGVVLAGLGAVGTAVSKGIKLVADISALGLTGQQLAAAKLQDVAADKQLAAAQLRAGKPVSIPGGGAAAGAASAILPVAGTVATITAGLTGFSALLDRLEKRVNEISNGAGSTGRTLLGSALSTIPGFSGLQVIDNLKKTFPVLQQLSDKYIGGLVDSLTGLQSKTKETAGAIDQAVSTLAGSANEAAIVGAFQKWKEDDARLVREATENRKKIISEGEAEIANITKRYSDQRASINSQFSERRSEIIRSYNEESARAETEYQQARIDASRNEAEQLRQIAADHQERLREIEKDGAERLGELAAARDALGLSHEQKRIDEAKAEENRSARRAADQVRRETEVRLAELANQYAAEQAQRAQNFQQQLAENEAQRQAELKQAAEQYTAEIAQQRAAQAAKLRDLQEGLNAERIRRREVFIQEVRDLDDSLLGERNLKSKYYALMLQDAEAWLARYRSTLPGAGGSSVPTSGAPFHDFTGYAYRGLYNMAGDGKKQFVLSGDATRAAENIVGQSLTQSNLMRALSLGGSRSVEYNDYRRMDGPTSKDDRAVFQQMAEAAILQALGR